MDNISLKLTTRYKSLQEGFEWNDIPPFAVITGVNDVGKTQLLEVIKGRSEKPDGRGFYTKIVREMLYNARKMKTERLFAFKFNDMDL